MRWRVLSAFVLVVMIAASIGMAVGAVKRQPGWFSHPGATSCFEEAVCSLVVYAGAIVIVVAKRGKDWVDELTNAAVFGSIAAAVEVVDSAADHIASAKAFSLAVNITALLVMVTLWFVAAVRTSRGRGRLRPGVITALMSAGITMVIAVASGFALELYIAPTSDSTIFTAFRQSGWTDARAFAVANTLHYGFTNLWLGPAIGLIVGILGAAIGWRMAATRKGGSATQLESD